MEPEGRGLSPGGTGSDVTRSQGWLASSWMVRILLGLLITATLGRYLDADEFGFYALVSSLLLLSAVVMDMGTGSVAIREIGRAPADERQILGALLTWRRTISWAAAAAFLLGALLVAPGPRRWVLLCCCVAALLSPAAGLSVVSQVRQAQGALQLMGLAAQGAVLTGCFLLHAVGVPGLYFACLPSIRELLNVAGTTLLARRRLGYVPRSRSRPPTGEQVLRGAKLQGAAVLVQAAYFHVDVILVRALRGAQPARAQAKQQDVSTRDEGHNPTHGWMKRRIDNSKPMEAWKPGVMTEGDSGDQRRQPPPNLYRPGHLLGGAHST